MNKSAFESFLYRLSVNAIHLLTGDTKDALTIQECLRHSSLFRPVLGCVQIWNIDFTNPEICCDIRFILSPDFMFENDSLTSKGRLYNLNWTFRIKHYDNGEDKEFKKIGEEDGVDGWLIKSEIINVNYGNIDTQDFELGEFAIAIHKTDNL